MPAFAGALAVGADEIELDLWMSRDGVAVVCHDPDLARTTDGSGRIDEMDWSQIRRVDAGIKCGEAWRGIRVPRFEEVLELVVGRAVLNIHLKHAGPANRLVHDVCDLIRDRGLMRLAYLACGSESDLSAAADIAPEIERCCIVHSADLHGMVSCAVQYGCRRIQFGRSVLPEHIQAAREAGLLCNLFWSDAVDDAREYTQQGIDVILTNCAHQLVGNID